MLTLWQRSRISRRQTNDQWNALQSCNIRFDGFSFMATSQCFCSLPQFLDVQKRNEELTVSLTGANAAVESARAAAEMSKLSAFAAEQVCKCHPRLGATCLRLSVLSWSLQAATRVHDELATEAEASVRLAAARETASLKVFYRRVFLGSFLLFIHQARIAELENEVETRISESKQFQDLKTMLKKKNKDLASLRQEYQKCAGAAAVASDSDD